MAIDFVEHSKGLFIFYVLIMVAFLPELLGCKLRDLLSENMYLKHLTAFFVLLSLVVFADAQNTDLSFVNSIWIAVVLYIWFILTTRSYVSFMLLTLLALSILYLLSVYKNQLIKKDSVKYKATVDLVNKIQWGVLITAIILTVIGFGVYTYFKYHEYSKEYSFVKFILGVRECKGEDKYKLF